MRPARRRAAPLLSALAIVAAGAVGGFVLLRPAPRPAVVPPPATSRALDVTPPPIKEPPRYHVSLAARPADAELELDGRFVGSGSYAGDFPTDGAEHTLKVSAEGYLATTLNFRDSPPPREVTLQARPTTAERPRPPADQAGAPRRPSRVPARPQARAEEPEEPVRAEPAPPVKKPAGPIRTENNAAIIDD